LSERAVLGYRAKRGTVMWCKNDRSTDRRKRSVWW